MKPESFHSKPFQKPFSLPLLLQIGFLVAFLGVVLAACWVKTFFGHCQDNPCYHADCEQYVEELDGYANCDWYSGLSECLDGSCTEGENHRTCPQDCSLTCGDGTCQNQEDAFTCPLDCPAICDDGFCTHDEDEFSCAEDCADPPEICGNGSCIKPETHEICPQDCSPDCPNDSCGDDESAHTCPQDCPAVCDDGHVTHEEDCEPGQAPFCATSCDPEGEETGRQHCTNDCSWGECVPPDEECNGRDDDCDGSVDEGRDCVAGTEAPCETSCGTTGTWMCTDSCSWPSECTPPEEVGNGIDDDCDGSIDIVDGTPLECVSGWSEEVSIDLLSEGRFRSIWGFSWDDVYAVTSLGLVFHFDGFEWTSDSLPDPIVGNPAPRSIWGHSEDNIYVVGENGYVAHFDGESWSYLNSEETSDFNAVHGRFSDKVYIVGNGGIMYAYDGTFHQVETGVDENLNDITVLVDYFGEDRTGMVAVGDNATLIRGYDELSPWLFGHLEYDINSIWGRNYFDKYYTGNGRTCQCFGSTPSGNLDLEGVEQKDIFGFEEENSFLFTVGENGTIWRYEGSNPEPFRLSNWHLLDSFTSSNLNGIWGSSEYNMFVISSDAVYHHCGSGW